MAAILRETVEAGTANVQMQDVSETRVIVVWSGGLTIESATRLTVFAHKKDSFVRLLGDPKGIVEEPAAKRGRLPISQQLVASAPAASALSAAAAASAEAESTAPVFASQSAGREVGEYRVSLAERRFRRAHLQTRSV